MNSSLSVPKVMSVKKGDVFTFVTYIDGQPRQLTGTVVVLMASAKARALGLTKSKRRRLFLGLRVEGYRKLFWKDKGQVKSVSSHTPEQQRTEPQREIFDRARLGETEEITAKVCEDLHEKGASG